MSRARGHQWGRSATAVVSAALIAAVALACGCGGRYSTGEASAREKEAVTRAVLAHVEELKALPPEARMRGSRWLTQAESVEVEQVTRMNGAYKALVAFTVGREKVRRYFLVEKADGSYRVKGMI